MIRSDILNKAKTLLLTLIIISTLPITTSAQIQNEALNDLERTFMPQFQMGYVFHDTPQLSGGLMTQTSMEYRDISNFIFRVNYDAFNSNMNLEYPVNDSATFTGKITFSELIGGVGYRQQLKRHNITAYIQSGIRFYGYPLFSTTDNQVMLNFDSRRVGLMRYSLGYEYAISPKLFFTLETLGGHALKMRDFWEEKTWYYGVTVGISAPLS